MTLTAAEQRRARRLNAHYAHSIPWIERFSQIVHLVELRTGPTPEDFANAVERWQVEHPPLEVNGVIDGATWRTMEPRTRGTPPMDIEVPAWLRTPPPAEAAEEGLAREDAARLTNDEDLDWRIDGSYAGEELLAPLTAAERRAQCRAADDVEPPGPMCVERAPPSPPPRRAPHRRSLADREAELRLRREASYRAAGITEGIERLHGGLMEAARRKGRLLSYWDWQEAQRDPSMARRLFEHAVQKAVEKVRDRVLDHVLGRLPGRLLGAPLTYATGLALVYEESRWRTSPAYRTQQIYVWLLGVLADNWAETDPRRNSGQIFQQLVDQALRYRDWQQNHWPPVLRWMRENFTATERGPRVEPLD